MRLINKLTNERFDEHDNIQATDISFLPREFDVAMLTQAIENIEYSVKNGLFYQAAEHSDWVFFIAGETLSQPNNISLLRRLEIERLKRFDYLGYVNESFLLRDKCCEKYELEKILAQLHIGNDEDKCHLFTAIGHSLWHENRLDTFNENFRKCEKLHSGISEGYVHKYIFSAFLEALKGRKVFLEGKKIIAIVKHFENAILQLDDVTRVNRSGLHIINQFARHLIEIYESEKKSRELQYLQYKIELIFDHFKACRTGTPNHHGELQPMKTLLQINFLILNVRKKELDKHYINEKMFRNFDSNTDLENQIHNARTELLFTTIMLGLGHLNPCPPIMNKVHNLFNNHSKIFDINNAKAHLKNLLRGLHWEKVEEIAATYYRILNYEVEVLPRNTPSFDLLIRAKNSDGSYIGVQVKRWNEKKFTSRDLMEWAWKIPDFNRRDKIERVIFFLTNSHDQSINNKVESLKSVLPNLKDENSLEFKSLDDAIDEVFSMYPGYLPQIYQILSN